MISRIPGLHNGQMVKVSSSSGKITTRANFSSASRRHETNESSVVPPSSSRTTEFPLPRRTPTKSPSPESNSSVVSTRPMSQSFTCRIDIKTPKNMCKKRILGCGRMTVFDGNRFPLSDLVSSEPDIANGDNALVSSDILYHHTKFVCRDT